MAVVERTGSSERVVRQAERFARSGHAELTVYPLELSGGAPVDPEGIVSHAVARDVDLLVVGSTIPFSPLSERIAATATCSVAVVPAVATDEQRTHPYVEIVCAVDREPAASRRTVEIAARLARAERGRLTLLHVLHPALCVELPAAYDHLAEIAAPYALDLTVDNLVVLGLAAEQIRRTADAHAADLLVTGPGASEDGGGLGPTAKRLLRTTPCTLLLARGVPAASARKEPEATPEAVGEY
jgi:nucleotide-binding universal stress UspA family protein